MTISVDYAQSPTEMNGPAYAYVCIKYPFQRTSMHIPSAVWIHVRDDRVTEAFPYFVVGLI